MNSHKITAQDNIDNIIIQAKQLIPTLIASSRYDVSDELEGSIQEIANAKTAEDKIRLSKALEVRLQSLNDNESKQQLDEAPDQFPESISDTPVDVLVQVEQVRSQGAQLMATLRENVENVSLQELKKLNRLCDAIELNTAGLSKNDPTVVTERKNLAAAFYKFQTYVRDLPLSRSLQESGLIKGATKQLAENQGAAEPTESSVDHINQNNEAPERPQLRSSLSSRKS